MRLSNADARQHKLCIIGCINKNWSDTTIKLWVRKRRDFEPSSLTLKTLRWAVENKVKNPEELSTPKLEKMMRRRPAEPAKPAKTKEPKLPAGLEHHAREIHRLLLGRKARLVVDGIRGCSWEVYEEEAVH